MPNPYKGGPARVLFVAHLALLACLFILLQASHATGAPGAYCSDWERDDKARAAQIKAQMKATARSMGVPERLMHLYDELPDCDMCLEDSPAVPSITLHYVPDGDPKKTDPLRNVKAFTAEWDADLEFEARHGMREGYVQAFYIYLGTAPCKCCTAENEDEYEDWQPYPEDPSQSPHWIDELGLDASLSVVFDDPGDLGDDPADLTELSADEKFPDLIEPPPLVLPPPLRPMTTLCVQCRPQVDAHNDLTATGNAKLRSIAKLKQSRGITSKAIIYRLRAIHAHRGKARTGDWDDVAQSMEEHLWDLEATYDRETRGIEAAARELADLLEELLGLKQAVLDCEETCRLEGTQAAPTTAPEPVPEGGEAALPPYVRIASHSCTACENPVAARNDLARDMNAIVTDMLAGDNSGQLLARWNVLRDELAEANDAVRECLSRCDELPADAPPEPAPPETSEDALQPAPEPGGEAAQGSAGVAEREPLTADEKYQRWREEFDRCEPCNEYWHRYREMADRAREKYAELRELVDRERQLEHYRQWYTERVSVLEAATRLDLSNRRKAEVHSQLRQARQSLREYEQQLRALAVQIRRTRAMARELETKALLIRAEWRHCVATRCKLSVGLPREKPYSMIGHLYDGTNPLADQTMLLFMTTTCDPCRAEARRINDWLLEQYRSWMAEYMVEHGYNFTAFERYNNSQGERWPKFLTQYELRKADLRACEKQCVEESDSALQNTLADPYQSPSIGNDTCIGDLTDELYPETGDATGANTPSPGCRDWAATGGYGGDCSMDTQSPGCQGSDALQEYTGDCSSGGCDQVAEPEPAPSPCDGVWSGGPPPLSCQGSPVMDWYTSDCSSGGCDQLANPQPAASPCEAQSTADEEGWNAPLGCSGVLRTIQASAQPNDPYLDSTGSIKPGLRDAWGLRAINVFGRNSDAGAADPVVVAVIDSGVDAGHPELRDSLWSNTAEIPGNGVDDDGNGFVDDVHGWNFLNDSADTRDTNGHGTIVAGIIGAAADNSVGIAGVNPAARIMPLKVTNYLGAGSSMGVAAAVVYAVNNGASVVNISLGGPVYSPAEQIALEYAARQGVLVVVASGNTGVDTAGFWPAGIPEAFTVAAIDEQGRRAAYSNWGSAVDIAAPGSDILSLRARYTDPAFFVDPQYPRESYIVGQDRLLYYASGTSFAAPFVSGVASLLLQQDPELEAAQLTRMLQQSAQDIEDPGYDPLTGYGMLNARAALDSSPGFYVVARIAGVAVQRIDGNVFVQVLGSADAERYAGATVFIGAGLAPTEWRRVATLQRPVTDGELAELPAAELSGAAQWTIRLETRHDSGRTREHCYQLKLK